MLLRIALLAGCVFALAQADEHEHVYENGEEVVLWMNTVGPYHNRQETYSYFSLPFCAGPKKSISHYHETLGEALQGVELEFSGLDIDYKADVSKIQYCEVELTAEKYQAFVYAVKNHYWYQMYIDDLPIWGIVGEIEEGADGSYYIWTHKKLDIGYNEKQIVDVNLTSEAKVKLAPDLKIPFTYEVKWHKSSVKFEDRFDKYLDPNFFQHRIHWFSIFNSFMMVIFLVGLVSMILMRTLRKDYARYSKDEDIDEMERDLGDEYGWKQVHGDVFRPATYPILFSSLIGTGYHILFVSTCVIIFAIVGELYTERGSLLSTAIFVYAATAPVNGYFGGALYARMGGKVWIKQMVISASLLPTTICGTAFFINFIAIYYHASRAIPFGTMVAYSIIHDNKNNHIVEVQYLDQTRFSATVHKCLLTERLKKTSEDILAASSSILTNKSNFFILKNLLQDLYGIVNKHRIVVMESLEGESGCIETTRTFAFNENNNFNNNIKIFVVLNPRVS